MRRARECCRGQYRELEAGMRVSYETYLAIVGGKTGAPLVAACELGALLGCDGRHTRFLGSASRFLLCDLELTRLQRRLHPSFLGLLRIVRAHSEDTAHGDHRCEGERREPSA